MIGKVKAILYHATKAGSKVIIITARPDFDNKELFLDTFRQHGIDIDKIYIERSGNLGPGSAADNKVVVFKKYLDQKIYKRMRLFDDAKSNLSAFLSLQKEFTAYQLDQARKYNKLDTDNKIKFNKISKLIKINEDKIYALRKELPSIIGKVVGQIEFAQNIINRKI